MQTARVRSRHANVTPASKNCRLGFEALEDRRLLSADHFLLKDIHPTGNSQASGYVEMHGQVYFTANDGTSGLELWRTDGSPGGAVRVLDLRPGPAGSQIEHLMNVNGSLYFKANDGNGFAVWKSDGTEAGTLRLADAAASSNLTNVNGTLYFHNFGDYGELWKSNGTIEGTSLVKEIDTDSMRYFTAVGNMLFFVPYDFDYGSELWRSDGTAAGTFMVKDIWPGERGAFSFEGYADPPQPSFVSFNGQLWFTADDGIGQGDERGSSLWRSNGTAAGTIKVMGGQRFGGAAVSASPSHLTPVGGNLFFVAQGLTSGFELYKTDGATVSLVRDINPGLRENSSVPNHSLPDHLINVNGTLFFTAREDSIHPALWKTDGSWDGTVMVSPIFPWGSMTAFPWASMAAIGDTLYFAADELYCSDGTSEGTQLAVDVNPGPATSNVEHLTNIKGTLLFTANDGQSGVEPHVLRTVDSLPSIGRYVFYNNSKFDGKTPGVSPSDDFAIAVDKFPYLAGSGQATYGSTTSYSRGINGIIIDLPNVGAVTAADFTFRVGATNNPGSWASAPAPSTVSVRPGAGSGGSDRVVIIWPDNAIQNTWLQVTIKANSNTGLTVPDVFYFGNQIGNSGHGDGASFFTSPSDELSARANPGIASVTNVFDYDRNGFVTATDQLIARSNPGTLVRISIAPPPSPSAIEFAPAESDPAANSVASAFVFSANLASAAVAPVPSAADSPVRDTSVSLLALLHESRQPLEEQTPRLREPESAADRLQTPWEEEDLSLELLLDDLGF